MSSEQGADITRRDHYLTLLGLIAATFTLLMLVDVRTLDTWTAGILYVFVSFMSAAMLVAALWTSVASRRLIRLGVIFGILMTLGAALTVGVGSGAADSPLLWGLVLLAAPVVVIRDVASHQQVRNDTIIGAVCAYLLIALSFSYAYVLIDNTVGPLFGASGPSTAIPYFSLVTITTLGYGDLSPVPEAARALAAAEAIIGQVFLVVFVARLVSVASNRRGEKGRPDLNPHRV